MSIIFQTPKDHQYFFGYFDKSPFDGGDRRLLAQRVDFMDRMPKAGEAVDIGYFDWQTSERFIKVSESRAWNWQTGCMAQWLGPDYRNEIIYNDLQDGKPCAVRLNLETSEVVRYPTAIGATDSQGRYALGVDYQQMRGLREGYGFQAETSRNGDTDFEVGEPGIWRLDLKTGSRETMVELAALKEHRPLPSMATSKHMLDNPVFNPCGTRFAFFHRWKLSDGAFYTRLYAVDSDGSNLRLLHDTGRVSHINWRGNHELVAFLGWETKINQLRKKPTLTKFVLKPLLPLYHLFFGHHWQISRRIRGDVYAIVNAEGGKVRKIGTADLVRDGHPSFTAVNEDWMLTDTYPDWRQKASLLLFHVPDERVHQVDVIESVRKFDETELRCDLHPRWSRNGRYVCIDTMSGGHRGMRVYDVSEIVDVP